MKRTASYRYLILDSAGTLLTHALLECPPTAPVWRLRLLDDDPDALPCGTRIHLVSMEDRVPSRSGEITGRDGAVLSVEPADSLGDDMRRNLRIPVAFRSYIYPLTGSWKGRHPILSQDLSCGGVAFYCRQPLAPGERLETVIPVTSQPLVLHTQVLRPLGTGPQGTLYATKFVDLVREEESMVREAVFGLQLETRRGRGANTTERNDD